MGWGWLEDAVDAVGEAAGGVVDSAAAAVTEVAAGAGDVIGAVGGAIDTMSGGTASWITDRVDNTVLDTLDDVTGGVVDIDFDGGDFTANVGIDDTFGIGVSVGESGFAASSDFYIADSAMSLTDDGFSMGSEAGVDWGPLPYANGHMTTRPNGDIDIGGHIQGTIPTQVGLLSGSVSNGFVKTDQGWGTFMDSDGKLEMPNGVTFAGGEKTGYSEDAAGNNAFNVSTNASVDYQGVATVGHSVGYERIEQDGVVAEHATGEVHVGALGSQVGASTEYTGVTSDKGTLSQWENDTSASGFDQESILQLGKALVEDEYGEQAADIADGAVRGLLSETGSSGTIGDDDVLMGGFAPAADPLAATRPAALTGVQVDPLDVSIPTFDAASTDPFADPLAASFEPAEAPADEFGGALSVADDIESSLDGLTDDPTFE